MPLPASSTPLSPFSPGENARLGWMQEMAPYGILTTGLDLQIQSWNQWLETNSGLPARRAVGSPLFEIFPSLKSPRLADYFKRALAGEVIVLSNALHSYLLPLPASSNQEGFDQMQQTARIGPLISDGQVCGTIVIIEDVTQREAQSGLLRRQHQRDQLLSAALFNLFNESDPQDVLKVLLPKVAEHLKVDSYFHYIVEGNPPGLVHKIAGGLEGFGAPEIISLKNGESLASRCLVDRSPVVVQNLQDSTDGDAALAKSMKLRSFACYPLLVADQMVGTLVFGSQSRDTFDKNDLEFIATLSQYVAVAIDRSRNTAALRGAQAKLSKHAEDLEFKVQERTTKLQETIAQLESFSYTVAHDLRAPIRALKSYCDVLLEDFPGLPEDAQLLLNRLARAGRHLDTLTRDLLQFSKVSRQEINLTPVNLNELIQDIVLLSPNLQDDILVIHPPLHDVAAQRTLLQQCLSNLFDNAVKFVQSGAKPRIVVRTELRATAAPDELSLMPTAFNPAVWPGRTEGDPNSPRVRIWVEDNGIGVAEKMHKKIFGIFERVAGPETYEGTGIGLAIVARAMQRMGGACGVESKVGEGSRFWLELFPVN